MSESQHKQTDSESSRKGRKPQRFRHTSKLGLLRFLAINLFVLVVPATIGYGLITQRHAREEVDRSFRNLSQLEFRFGQQFDRMKNFTRSLYNNFAHPGTCESIQRIVKDAHEVENASISGITLSCERAGDKFEMQTQKPGAHRQNPDEPLIRFSETEVAGKPSLRASTLHRGFPYIDVPFSALLQDFAPNLPFSEVYLVSADGMIWGNVAAEAKRRDEESLQPDRGLPDRYNDLKRVFARAISENDAAFGVKLPGADIKDDKKEASHGNAGDSKAPDKPLLVEDRLGDSAFQVFIQPLHALVAAVNWDDCKRPEEKNRVGGSCTAAPSIYLVGLKQDRTIQQAISQLGPRSAALLGLFVCVLVLSFPLIRISFLEAHDSISRPSLALTVITAGLLVGVLAIAALAYRMEGDVLGTLDALGEKYAGQIAERLEKEIGLRHDDFKRFRKDYFDILPGKTLQPLPGKDAPPLLGVGSELTCEAQIQTLKKTSDLDTVAKDLPQAAERNSKPADCAQPKVQRTLWWSKGVGKVTAAGTPLNRQWNPIGSAYATDEKGDLRGPRIDFVNRHDAHPHGINLAFRPYFRSLELKQGWLKTTMDSSKTSVAESFVIERLFNLGDGEKLSQFAIPRNSENDHFSGIVSGEVRLSSVIDAVLPLGLKFAVVETATGTVLFHSDDARSLVENFYDEVRPTDMRALFLLRRPDVFAGEYHGRQTRFAYMPMNEPIPWTVAVFYDPAAHEEAVLLTALTALVALSAVLLAGALIIMVMLRFAGLRFSFAWPQWRLREVYLWVALLLAALVVLEWIVLPNINGPFAHGLGIFLMMWLVVTCAASLLSPSTLDWQRWRACAFGGHLLGLIALSILESGTRLLTGVSYWFIEAAVVLYALTYFFYFRFLYGEEGIGALRLSAKNPWGEEPPSLVEATGVAKFTDKAIPLLLPDLSPSSGTFKRRYLVCVGLAVVALVVVPAADLFQRAQTMFSSAKFRLDTEEMNGALDTRRVNFDREQKRLLGKEYEDSDFAEFKEPEDVLVEEGVYGIRYIKDKGMWCLDGKDNSDSRTTCGGDHPWQPAEGLRRARGWETTVWSLMPPATESSAMLKLLAKCTDAEAQECGEPSHRENLIAIPPMQALATHSAAGIQAAILWLLPLTVGLLAYLLLRYVAQRVLGAEVPWFGRLGALRKDSIPESEWGQFRFAMLVRPDTSVRDECAKGFQRYDLRRWPESFADVTREGARDLVLTAFYRAVLISERRALLLETLEYLTDRTEGKLRLLVSLPPLFRVLKPGAFPDVPDGERPSDGEMMRWTAVMAKIRKVYRAASISQVPTPVPTAAVKGCYRYLRLREFIVRETSVAKPELHAIRQELLSILGTDACKQPGLTDRDIVEYVDAHAGAIFRRHWQACTREERLALYQLASSRYLNPANQSVIAHLRRRSLISFEPNPRVKSRAFATFILRAELPGKFEEWSSEAAEGIWQTIRTPLLIVVFLLIGWLAYSAGEVFQALTAVLVGTITFFGQLMRAVGYTRNPIPVPDK